MNIHCSGIEAYYAKYKIKCNVISLFYVSVVSCCIIMITTKREMPSHAGFGYYLRLEGYVFARLCLFVCLSVCQQDNSKSYGRIFLKFSGNVGNGKNYQWNFRYHCFPCGIRETAAKPKMVLPPSEQHGLALTAFQFCLWLSLSNCLYI